MIGSCVGCIVALVACWYVYVFEMLICLGEGEVLNTVDRAVSEG